MKKIEAWKLMNCSEDGVYSFNFKLYDKLSKESRDFLVNKWTEWYLDICANDLANQELLLGDCLFSDEEREEYGDEYGRMPEDLIYERAQDVAAEMMVEPFQDVAIKRGNEIDYFIEPIYDEDYDKVTYAIDRDELV